MQNPVEAAWQARTGFKIQVPVCYDVIKSLSLLNSLLWLDRKRLLKASPTNFNTVLKLIPWGADWFFIYWILKAKTTKFPYWVQADFCWFLIEVISERFCLFYGRPVNISPESSVLFIVANWVNVRILPDLTDKIFNNLQHNMGGLGLVPGFVHRIFL